EHQWSYFLVILERAESTVIAPRFFLLPQPIVPSLVLTPLSRHASQPQSVLRFFAAFVQHVKLARSERRVSLPADRDLEFLMLLQRQGHHQGFVPAHPKKHQMTFVRQVLQEQAIF
ncbi:MAG: hypothetical protein RR505_11980, partial [Raoultibacter sp.]